MAHQETGRQEPQTEKRTGTGRQDALELLKQDHRAVEQLFKRFREAGDENDKSAIAERICLMLKVHTQIEEEIFYPAARRRIEDKELIDEALVEHKSAKELIGEIEETEAGDSMMDARVQVLCEQITHHVHEEETELFPEVQKAEIDLKGLGARLAERRQQLLRELGAEMEEDAGAAEPRSFGADRQS